MHASFTRSLSHSALKSFIVCSSERITFFLWSAFGKNDSWITVVFRHSVQVCPFQGNCHSLKNSLYSFWWKLRLSSQAHTNKTCHRRIQNTIIWKIFLIRQQNLQKIPTIFHYSKKRTSEIRSPFLSYTGFEPVTHALKGRCSTYWASSPWKNYNSVF